LNRTRENFRNNERGHFVQHIGGTGLDGSMLLMPLVRFVSARDPRWLATLDAIEKNLVCDGMVYRYHNDDQHIDGLPGTEGAFAACSLETGLPAKASLKALSPANRAPTSSTSGKGFV
jgi:GH15 family glucan-1,4-alpha-glucosidase